MSDTTLFANIPEEIQIEILSQLPPKSVSICKCVSKHWNDTLTVQAFLLNQSRSYDEHSKLAFVAVPPDPKEVGRCNKIIAFQLTDNNTNTAIIAKATTIMSLFISYDNNFIASGITTSTEEGYREYFSYHLNDLNDLIFWHCYGSNICNDLICLYNKSSKSGGLLNVKTQEYISLPAMTTESVDQFIRFWYALGFDPVNKVFKVLSIYDRREGCGSKAAILTIGSKNWKPIVDECLPCSVNQDSRHWSRNDSFCLDGVIYWVNETEIDDHAIMLTVVAFDLNSETFRDYKLVVDDAETFRYYLTSLKGCPTLFIWKNKSNEIQQLTLFNHKNPNVAWKRRKFSVHDFPKNLYYGSRSNCVAGGTILLHRLRSIGALRQLSAEVQENESWYILHNLEKFALE